MNRLFVLSQIPSFDLKCTFICQISHQMQVSDILLRPSGSSITPNVVRRLILKSFVFLDIMSCIPVKVNQPFGGTCHLGWRVSQPRSQHEAGSKHSIASCKMSLNFQWTTLLYIREEWIIHHHCCEKLKSYIGSFNLV
jgi:hypothetical protein